MKKVFILIITIPLGLSLVYGETPSTRDYVTCQKEALSKREAFLTSARGEYLKRSTSITEQTKQSFEKIGWYVNTSYRLHAKKILNDKKQELDTLHNEMKQARLSIQETYKAEEALCKLNFPEGSSGKNSKKNS